MKKRPAPDDRTKTEIASILALGVLRQKQRINADNKALMAWKALDFRLNGSIHVMQEQDNE
ncbi:MAG: hypothetical protein KGI37_05285 [Alphaproteobacteria bacterium]|nr:hypothetical protein [Alphaproteobacteria bacterium]